MNFYKEKEILHKDALSSDVWLWDIKSIVKEICHFMLQEIEVNLRVDKEEGIVRNSMNKNQIKNLVIYVLYLSSCYVW